MIKLDKSARDLIKKIYCQFESVSEISVSSPDYKKTVIDYFVAQGLLGKIEASTLSGWAYIIMPTYEGELLVSELANLKSAKVEAFIARGKSIMAEEYHHITEPGLIMPDYISGPKSDQWFNEISIFNSRSLVNHPLHDQIENVCKKHRKMSRPHEEMMGYLRTLLEDEELDADSNQSNTVQQPIVENVSNQGVNIMPKVFISYSWEDDAHKEWVRSLADSLLANGIDATLDQYDLSLGDRLPQFMEQSIAASDYVLIICTPTYKTKSDKRSGGVGYEGHIISGELLTTGNERKFIPVIRKGTVQTAIPNCLSGKLGIDLSSEQYYEMNFNDLITTLQGKKKKPPINKASYRGEAIPALKQIDQTEPIHILGIITDQVTVPKMDGTRGSALYKIPFRLSRTPSTLWKELFVRVWNSPPRFTTMHRPGIASVYGDQIILDGTTIEEVRDYHRETLLLCVRIANDEESRILREEQLRKELEESQKNKHFSNVRNVAEDLKF